MTKTDVILTINGGKELVQTIDDSPALVGLETSQYSPLVDVSVDFCDWPFTNEEVPFEWHLKEVEKYQPKYAVAPDVEGEFTLDVVIDMGDELLEHADEVIIVPKECHPAEVPDRFLIGYPNQENFGSSGNEWWKSSYPSDTEMHILGGSPDSQIELNDYFNIQSVDGAVITKYAEYGRIWTPGGQLERPDISYYRRVYESLANLHATWNMGESGE